MSISENALTVGEIREMIAGYPEEAIMIVATDADGSSFSPVAAVEAGEYTPSYGFHGDFVPTDDVDAVCLYPEG